MEEKKYILTDETMEFNGHILHRIKAIKDFSIVKKGEFGGWIESEANLSQEGECWVHDNAKVYDKAKVYGNAIVRDDCIVHCNAKVYGNAVLNNDVDVYNNARIYGHVWLYGIILVHGNAKVYGNANVHDRAVVCGNAKVYGDAEVFGFATICGDAKIKSNKDYAVYKNSWSSGRYFTWTRSNNMWKVGCFYGIGEELITKAYEDSPKKGKCYSAIVNANRLISNID